MKDHSNCKLIIVVAVTAFYFISCHTKKKADRIFFNGVVYTVDKDFHVANAFAVEKDRIIAAGTDADILNHFSSDQKTDLNGKAVYPGFLDAHCHFVCYGTTLFA